MLGAFARTVRRFCPALPGLLDGLRDGRLARRCVYLMRPLVLVALMGFVCLLGSRRRLRTAFNGPAGLANLNRLAGTDLATLPHPDTIAAALKKLPAGALDRVRTRLMRALLRSRALEPFRLRGRFYLVAIDATGLLTFRRPHCPHCLVRRLADGRTVWQHHVLEAKLVCANGMVFSLDSEFIANADGAAKQDCEIKAFRRLIPRLRAAFPCLPMCALLDGLYLNAPTMRLLRQKRLRYFITFKKGSLPSAFEEFEALAALTPRHRRQVVCGAVRRCYRWVEDLPHGGEAFHVIECVETDRAGRARRFAWATNLRPSAAAVEDLCQKGARLRWKIENEGFNRQKNGGYALEHAYSQDWDVAQHLYVLLQIAHMISQLLVKGVLRQTPVVRLFGSLRAFAARLLEAWRNVALPDGALAGGPAFQVRFHDG